jgi:hypothetical protein
MYDTYVFFNVRHSFSNPPHFERHMLMHVAAVLCVGLYLCHKQRYIMCF